MNERRTTVAERTPARDLADAILNAHTVIGAALVGRTTGEHVKRAARRLHQAARVAVFGPICPVCGRPLAARVWVTYRGVAYPSGLSNPLAAERAYCREHCAVKALLQEGWPFIVEPRESVGFELVEAPRG